MKSLPPLMNGVSTKTSANEKKKRFPLDNSTMKEL